MRNLDELFKTLRFMKALIENGKSAESAAGVAARAFDEFKKDDLLRLYERKFDELKTEGRQGRA